MTGLLHEKEFSRTSFVKGGGALIVGLGALGALGAGRASGAGSTNPAHAGYVPGPLDPSQVDTWVAGSTGGEGGSNAMSGTGPKIRNVGALAYNALLGLAPEDVDRVVGMNHEDRVDLGQVRVVAGDGRRGHGRQGAGGGRPVREQSDRPKRR